MRKTGLVLAALLLASGPAYAGGDPFEEARIAIMGGKVEAAMMNVITGAISANTHNEEGYTLLHYAAQAGSLDAVQQLLDKGADPQAKTKDGKTPMDFATKPEIRAELEAAAKAQPAN